MSLTAIRHQGSSLTQRLYHRLRRGPSIPCLALAASASLISWFVASHSLTSSFSQSTRGNSDQLTKVSGTMPQLKEAREAALWGVCIGDSISMPVHWYYDTDDIRRDFNGWLTGFQAPCKRHPSSILTISATGGAGRSTFISGPQKNIVGDVILHGKLKYWNKKDRSVHYHQGMSAGDNTLNTVLTVRSALQASKLSSAASEHNSVLSDVLTEYVRFMTTPEEHNDTYADSSHREFFRSWVDQRSPTQPEEVMTFAEKRVKDLESEHLDHNIDAISALVHPTAMVLHYAQQSEDEAAKQAVRLVRLTYASANLDPFVDVYARMLHGVLNGASLKDKVKDALTAPPIGNKRTWEMVQKFSQIASEYPKGSDRRLDIYQAAVSQMGLACYIKGAFTSLLFLANEFHDDFEAGVLTNANCGGENVGRGGALGALLGAEAARTGKQIPQRFRDGLNTLKPEVEKVISAWK